jgi:hypothetical protein
MSDKTQVLSIKCIMCKQSYEFSVKPTDYFAWKQGEFVQYAFPYLSPGERELLISQICDNCFPSDSEED